MNWEIWEPGDFTRYNIGRDKIEPNSLGAGILHIRRSGGYFVVIENFNLMFVIPAGQEIYKFDIFKNANIHFTVIEAVAKWIRERLGIEIVD